MVSKRLVWLGSTQGVEIDDAVYVLDFFKKKSTKGVATPQVDLDRIETRLKYARRMATEAKKERKA